jgi:hypothetical protein
MGFAWDGLVQKSTLAPYLTITSQEQPGLIAREWRSRNLSYVQRHDPKKIIPREEGIVQTGSEPSIVNIRVAKLINGAECHEQYSPLAVARSIYTCIIRTSHNGTLFRHRSSPQWLKSAPTKARGSNLPFPSKFDRRFDPPTKANWANPRQRALHPRDKHPSQTRARRVLGVQLLV